MNIPNRLTALAADIDEALKRDAANRSDWVEIKLDLCRLLFEAKAELPDTTEFGHWCDEHVGSISHQDRAAYIEMGADLETARKVLSETKRASIRYIRDNEFRKGLTHAGKSLRRKPPEAEARDEKIIQDWDAGAPVKQASQKSGLGERRAARIIQDEKLRREGIEEGQLLAQPLSATAQRKLDVHMRKLEKEFDWRVRAAAQKMYDEWYENGLKRYADQVAKIERQLQQHKGVFRRPQFVLLQKCLHPDTGKHVDDTTRNEAFRVFMENEVRLCDMTPERVFPANWPRTREDLEARRAEVKARNSERARKAAASRKAKEVPA